MFVEPDEECQDACGVGWGDLRPEVPAADGESHAECPLFSVNERQRGDGRSVVDVSGDAARVEVFEADGTLTAHIGSVHDPDMPFAVAKAPIEGAPKP